MIYAYISFTEVNTLCTCYIFVANSYFKKLIIFSDYYSHVKTPARMRVNIRRITSNATGSSKLSQLFLLTVMNDELEAMEVSSSVPGQAVQSVLASPCGRSSVHASMA
jgi:hypothetical protein